ncbi:lysophospholipid acyltransferase family protein [Flexibacterium corallicola]|uniref:lysophospholipid acyltransferase family protein n=1 Tax=Flexibacterium corallicola TaxID=3037259 RepID=UPI00286F51FF|nr:lysophospholipid acyltransferase family protein [Pseudovibrio sp. M1P-2-3]
MNTIRTLIYNTAFYSSTLILMLVALPVFLLPRKYGMWVMTCWSVLGRFWLRWLVGIKSEFRGTEHIIQGGCIVASQHQSAWDTFGMCALLHDQAIVIKKQLLYIPLFGWYEKKFKLIAVRRDSRIHAMGDMVKQAKAAIKEERNILIFPEGTRRAPGAVPQYKSGIYFIYKRLNCPVVPAALNSGLYWPRRDILNPPGTIRVEFLPAIPPGLPKKEFMSELSQRIESASDRLLNESELEVPDNPLLKAARERQKQWQENGKTECAPEKPKTLT